MTTGQQGLSAYITSRRHLHLFSVNDYCMKTLTAGPSEFGQKSTQSIPTCKHSSSFSVDAFTWGWPWPLHNEHQRLENTVVYKLLPTQRRYRTDCKDSSWIYCSSAAWVTVKLKQVFRVVAISHWSTYSIWANTCMQIHFCAAPHT